MTKRLKMFIGIFIFCLIFTVIFVVSTVSASAAEVVDSGTCGTNVTWSLDSAGTLTISGSGGISTSTQPWNSYVTQIKTVVISNGVTSIGSYTFADCSLLTSIDIPDSVTNISYSAFSGCSSLTSIKIPDGVTSIGSYTFADCSSLTSIDIPDSVTSIGSSAFYGCSSLTSIKIPDGVTSIDPYAFEDCISLTSIDIPNSVTSIGYSAFDGCKALTSVKIHDGMTSIGERAFYNCRLLTNIDIGDGVTNIGNYAFYGCSSLTSIKIPYGVTSIGNHAFRYCSSLTSIDIPDSVTSIDYAAFGDCSSLVNVKISNGMTSIASEVFENCRSLISIVIPDGVTSIGKYVFYGCSSLASIDIHDGVTSIGDRAFYNCSSLKTVNYGGTEADWGNISIGSDNFNLTSAEIVYVPEVVDSGTCGTGVTWSLDNEGVLTISGSGNMQYYQSGSEVPWYSHRTQIKSVIISDGVTGTGMYAFQGCSALTSVDISDSVTSIGDHLFDGCSSLTSIYIPDSVTSIGHYAFYKCTKLENMNIPDGVTRMRDSVFYDCISLKSIVIPDGVTSIGGATFWGCTSLTSINIPDGVTLIGMSAFNRCRSLESVVIPDSVTEISMTTFDGCSSLISIDIPDSVTSIGTGAFNGCSSLKTVNYGGLKSDWDKISIENGNSELLAADIVCVPEVIAGGTCGKNVTWSLDSAGTLTISGNGRMDSYYGSSTSPWYSYGAQIKSVIISDGITDIGSNAFEGCSVISITIPDSVVNIYEYVIENCSSLTSLYFDGTVAQWNNISKNLYWNYRSGGYVVYCSDGTSLKLREDIDGLKAKCLTIESEFDDINSLISRHSSICDNPSCKLDIYISDLSYSRGNYLSFQSQTNKLDAQIRELESATDLDFSKMSELNEDLEYLKYYFMSGVVIDAQLAAVRSNIEMLDRDCVTMVTIPTGTTSIGNYEFYCYNALVSVTIPDSVISIRGYAFYDCSSLKSIIFEGTVQQWQAITKDPSWDISTGEYTIHCSDGEISKDGTIKCYKHLWGEWNEVTAPTCVEEGLERRECERCHNQETNVLEKLDHSYNSAVTAPTCTAQGYTTFTCTKCNYSYVGATTAALGHDMSPATCTEAPMCKRDGCNHTEGSKLGHTNSPAVDENRVDATCTTDGHYESVVYCSVCKVEVSRTTVKIDKLGHTNSPAVEENRVDATCTTDGHYESVVYCSVCKVEVSRTTVKIDKLGHSFSDKWTIDVEPACTKSGSKSRHCTVCGEKTEVTLIDPTGHTEVIDGAVEATCTKTGLTEGKHCSVCNTVILEQIETPIVAHTYSDRFDESCNVCGFTRVADCRHDNTTVIEGTPAQCVTPGLTDGSRCLDCEEILVTQQVIPATGHKSAEAVEENRVEPDCTTDGHYDSAVYCSVCHAEISRATINIDKLGHTNSPAVEQNRVGATCTTDGQYESVIYCSVCEEELSREAVKIDKTGHNYGSDWTVDTEPTCTAAGSKSHHCTACGEKTDVTEISATGHSYSGDSDIDCNACGEVREVEKKTDAPDTDSPEEPSEDPDKNIWIYLLPVGAAAIVAMLTVGFVAYKKRK